MKSKLSTITKNFILPIVILLVTVHAVAQDSDTTFKPSGKFWATTFVDYYYKAHNDSLNRGGANQYSGIEKGRNAFQFRRIYLGYNYNITPKFSSEILLASEDNFATSNGTTGGDLLNDNKISVYIKLANLRWKNIFKGTDLLIGQAPTPAFPLLIEPIWSYRSVERTLSDIRRTPSFDLGVSLQGKFDPLTENFGYNLMIGNGTGARPENDRFKTFYADVWAKFLNKRIVIDLYTDYQRQNYTSSFHHTSNMIKGFAAFTTPSFTAGVEAFINNRKNDVVGTKGVMSDTLSSTAVAVSFFVRGAIVKDKLGYFGRVDRYNPDTKFTTGVYDLYKGLTSTYEPNNKETFITAGLDFTAAKSIHIIPNIWYNNYHAQSFSNGSQDHDLVYRLTLSYTFGK